jgi:hypothetical protein
MAEIGLKNELGFQQEFLEVPFMAWPAATMKR